MYDDKGCGTLSQLQWSMEQASNVGDTRKLYQLIRQVSAEFLPSPTYAVPCEPPPPPSEGEVADAIRKLRNNKAPGEDGILAEIFKSCVDTLALWLHEVIERAWRDKVVPDDWDLGILVPILKKGDKTRCENYRGISLIDVAAKIFAIVLLRRFQAVRDSRTRPNQAGFRAGRGCADQIFTLRRILEFHHSYQQPTAVCFVDFSAAFDSVHRESLWRIMALDGVPAKIIAMIKAYYRSTTARVLVRNNLSQPFGIRSGVRQGCILSPILFNNAIGWILGRALRESDGVEFAPGHRLTDLDYADDIALLASSFGDLQSVVSRVNEVAKSAGMSINAGKTKVFSSCIPDQEKAPLGIDGCQLEEVDSFKYLGARLLPNGQSKDDIVSRIDAACWVFSSLRKCLWNRRDLSIATKIRVYRAVVRSVLLYDCECWALRVEDERKLEVFDHHCLRTILRMKFTDFVSNETVRARCNNLARITQAIQERRLRWFGHVLRRPPQELSVTAFDPAPLPIGGIEEGGGLVLRVSFYQPLELLLLKRATGLLPNSKQARSKQQSPSTALSAGTTAALRTPVDLQRWLLFNEKLPAVASQLNTVSRVHLNTFPEACRLAKRWLSGHGLPVVRCPDLGSEPRGLPASRPLSLLGDSDFSPEFRLSEIAVELMVVRAGFFTKPVKGTLQEVPFGVVEEDEAALSSASPLATFLRFLRLLSTFDWAGRPLVLDLNDGFVEGVFAIFMDLHLLVSADFLVCTASSNVCRLAYELLSTKSPIHGDASFHMQSVDRMYYCSFSQRRWWRAIADFRQEGVKLGDSVSISSTNWDGFVQTARPTIRKQALPAYLFREVVQSI
nr:unnamed protein product [Spirometra erinaceieuropaei]